MIGHEEGIELRSLQRPRKPLDMGEVEVGVGPCPRIAPGARVNRDRAHEGAEMKLAGSGHCRTFLLIRDERQGCSRESLGDRLPHLRSEEHTSELQSLMRISYAVFCLKKKNKNHTHVHNSIHQFSTYYT